MLSNIWILHMQTTFNAPAGNDPLALDMSTMGKGQIWVNGQSIGRHWIANPAHGHCGPCNYAGPFNEAKCLSDCGQPSQRWYKLFFSCINSYFHSHSGNKINQKPERMVEDPQIGSIIYSNMHLKSMLLLGMSILCELLSFLNIIQWRLSRPKQENF